MRRIINKSMCNMLHRSSDSLGTRRLLVPLNLCHERNRHSKLGAQSYAVEIADVCRSYVTDLDMWLCSCDELTNALTLGEIKACWFEQL